MATWEDGPEYAPIERPDQFSLPAAAPLEVTPPAHQPAADAPKDRPRFDDPRAAVAPLSTLVPPTVEDRRDPQQPFDVVAGTMTSTTNASAWGSAHWSGQGGSGAALTGGPAAPAQPWGPPGTDPWAGGPAPTASRSGQTAGAPAPYGAQVGQSPPTQGYPPYPPQGFPTQQAFPAQQAFPTQQNFPARQGFPAPGTPQWFGPGPPQMPVAYDQPVTAKRVAEMVTPGLIICLALGGIIYVLAPITLGLGFWLSGRVRVAKAKVKLTFRLALAALVALALIGALAADPYFSAWWSFVAGWATFISWTALVLTFVFVYRALKQNVQPVPPARPPWG